jgi:hypothetical protein
VRLITLKFATIMITIDISQISKPAFGAVTKLAGVCIAGTIDVNASSVYFHG